MSARRALITGITGQDGSYLAERLLAEGYEVHGALRHVAAEDQGQRLARLHAIRDRLHLHSFSMESASSVYRVLQEVRPDECYHLAAQSFVTESFADPYTTFGVNIIGTAHLLDAIRDLGLGTRTYFAGSSEMFGNTPDEPQHEDSPCLPASPYGVSKHAGFQLVRIYREAYGLFVCSGILFNHESPRRGREFVTRHVSTAVAEIAAGRRRTLGLGNLQARRDWGYAPEYVDAMWRMLQLERPGDFVIATGRTHSVEDLAREAFAVAGLDWKEHVVTDETRRRPLDVKALRGDVTRAREVLGWGPRTSFRELVRLMVEADRAALRDGEGSGDGA